MFLLWSLLQIMCIYWVTVIIIILINQPTVLLHTFEHLSLNDIDYRMMIADIILVMSCDDGHHTAHHVDPDLFKCCSCVL